MSADEGPFPLLAPRWRKALRDLGERPGRAALAVLAMAAGLFGVGMILTARTILARELRTMYDVTRPASAIVAIDGVSDEHVARARRVAGVREAEARPMIGARVRVGRDEWMPLVLFVVRDFHDLRIDRFTADSGAWPPPDDGILLERTALSVAKAKVGDSVTMRTADGVEQALRIAGTVHAPGLAPAWMDHLVTGFVTWKSLARIDPRAEGGRLAIIVARDGLNVAHIQRVAQSVKAALESDGAKVGRIEIPPPGRHPHADQMDTFLYLLGAFGALTFVLSSVLVANMIHALLIEQVRQVGVMKVLGASTGQIAALYHAQVLVLAAFALAIGMPGGLVAGRRYAEFSGSILNVRLTSTAVPAWVFAAQLGIGLLLPLAIALIPIHLASRVTPHQALHPELSRRRFGTHGIERLLARVRRLPRPLLLSLRSTFERRGRLVLTVGTLAIGGAVFISALNVAAGWSRLLRRDEAARLYDLDVRLSQRYPVARIDAAIASVPDVVRIEHWPDGAATLPATTDRLEQAVSLVAPEPETPLLKLRVLEGRWLRATDRDAVVINQTLRANIASTRVGGPLVLRVGGREVRWTVVGVIEQLGTHSLAFVPPATLLAATGQTRETSRIARVVTRRHDPQSQVAAARKVERALQQGGLAVQGITSIADNRKAFADHLIIIESALVFAALLVVLVGGLGLTSTLTLNVIERTRELGILSAIGATPRTIAGHIVFEGVLMGVLSWCIALLFAIPATAVLLDVAGRMFLKTSLGFLMSPAAMATWLLLVTVLAAISSFYPARRAVRLTVREALSYE